MSAIRTQRKLAKDWPWPLTPGHIEVLRSLPDPTEPLRGGVRAKERVGSLAVLEDRGYAENRKGWWRKTPDGVRYLRELGRPHARL